jgi:hypothetical protein
LNSKAPAGSDDATDCQCNAGYTGPNAGACIACAAGKYKDVKATFACRICPPNTFNPNTGAKDFASCRACPAGSNTRKKDGHVATATWTKRGEGGCMDWPVTAKVKPSQQDHTSYKGKSAPTN